jgi:polysaccharide export outer membrane protein
MPVFLHDLRAASASFPLLLAAAAILLASGCSTSSRGGSVPYEPTNFGRPDVEATLVAEGPQRISPLDKLKVSVFQVESLSGDFQVDNAGNIDFPLIGTVAARGKTTNELAQVIATGLGKKYLRSPNVQVALVEASPQTITVDGSVRGPGVFPLKGTTTLMRAVAMAKGTSEDANPSRVIVFRTVNGQRSAGAFDLQAIRRAESEDPVIYGNDLVIVDGSRARTLFRDVLNSLPILGLLRPF